MSNTGHDINASKQNIDKEKLTRLLPEGVGHKVTNEIIELINSMEKDTGLFQDYMEESLLSNLPVLRTVKVTLREYINAIKYCNLKRSMTNEKAWEIVFPDKYKRLKDSGMQTSNHVAMYNSTKIVTKLDANMMVDIKIQYAPVLHQAIKKQVQLMNGVSSDGASVSPNVQHLASKTLIETLMPEEEQQVSIKIGQSNEAKQSQEKMFNELKRIAEDQQKLLKSGHKIEDIQKLNLTHSVEDEDEIVDVDYDDAADLFEDHTGPQFN